MWLMLFCTCSQKETVLLFAFLPPAQRFLFKYLLLCVHIPAIHLVGRWLHLTTGLILSKVKCVLCFFFLNKCCSKHKHLRRKRDFLLKKNVLFHRTLFRMSSSWLVNQNKNHHPCIDFTFAEETDADSFYVKKKKLNKDRCFHKDWRSWFSAFLYQATIESIFSF